MQQFQDCCKSAASRSASASRFDHLTAEPSGPGSSRISMGGNLDKNVKISAEGRARGASGRGVRALRYGRAVRWVRLYPLSSHPGRGEQGQSKTEERQPPEPKGGASKTSRAGARQCGEPADQTAKRTGRGRRRATNDAQSTRTGPPAEAPRPHPKTENKRAGGWSTIIQNPYFVPRQGLVMALAIKQNKVWVLYNGRACSEGPGSALAVVPDGPLSVGRGRRRDREKAQPP